MNDFKTIFSHLKDDLALTSEERFLMRSELERVSAVPASGAILSPFSFFSVTSLRFAGALLIVLIAGFGGTSALAGTALPGDVLYGVKIHLNESLERTLAPTPLAKADVDIKHAEERLSEVELLAAKGNADEADVKNAAAEVALNVASAADTAQDLSASGDQASADGINANISSTLLAHADILSAQADTLTDAASGQDLRALSFAVSATADQADMAEAEDASTTDSGNPAVTEEVALSRESHVKDLIQKLTDALGKDGVPAETHDELSAELAKIDAEYRTAVALVVSGDYENAAASYDKLQQRTYRALALIRSARRINAATGQDVVITLNDAGSPAEESSPKPALMKAAATLAAPALEAQNQDEATTEAATSTEVLKRGDDGHTLQFRVRARSWNP